MSKRFSLTTLVIAMLLAGNAHWAHGHSQVSSARLDFETLIKLQDNVISIECDLTLNRPGAYLEVLKIDTDQDGDLSPQEQASYFKLIGQHIIAGIEVKINDSIAALQPVGQIELTMPFRKQYRFIVEQPADWQSGTTLEFHNDCFLEYSGSVTTIVNPGDGADIVYCSQWDSPGEQALVERGDSIGVDLQERDIVIRYRAGTGLGQPDDQSNLFDLAELEEKPADQAGIQQSARHKMLSVTLLALAVGAVFVLVHSHRAIPRLRQRTIVRIASMALPICLLMLSLLLFRSGWDNSPVPDDAEAVQIFRELHCNIYAAFGVAGESDIYDVLAGSLDGELLDEIYNEVHTAALSRDATSFNIRRVKPLSSKLLPTPTVDSGAAYCVRHNWRVYGTVSHFGHRHSRTNEYRAVYTVAARKGLWRITDVRIEQQQRVNPVPTI
jgi:hypothetical protein